MPFGVSARTQGSRPVGSRPPNTPRPQREFVAVSSQFLYPTTTTPFQHRAFPSGPENPVPPPEVPDHPRTPQGRAPFPVLRQARPEHWRAGPGRQQPHHLPPRNSPNPPPNRLARGHVGSLRGFSDLDFLITSSTAPASATASCSPPSSTSFTASNIGARPPSSAASPTASTS